MNWYVLYTLGYKTEKVVRNLNQKRELTAFVPQHEFYYRKTKEYWVKPMFPGYVFIKTQLQQEEFNVLLMNMSEEKEGIIRQLTNNVTSPLKDEEIHMFEVLLDASFVVKMSEAYIDDGKAVVQKGPLKTYEQHIVKIDKRNQYAYLDLSFMDRYIKVGLKITNKN